MLVWDFCYLLFGLLLFFCNLMAEGNRLFFFCQYGKRHVIIEKASYFIQFEIVEYTRPISWWRLRWRTPRTLLALSYNIYIYIYFLTLYLFHMPDTVHIFQDTTTNVTFWFACHNFPVTLSIKRNIRFYRSIFYWKNNFSFYIYIRIIYIHIFIFVYVLYKAKHILRFFLF